MTTFKTRVEYSWLQQHSAWDPRMTLAVLLSFCIFCSGPATPDVRAWTQSNQDASQVKPADSQAPVQSTSAPQTKPPAPANNPAPGSATAPKAPAAAKRKPQSKAKNTAPCNSAANPKPPSNSPVKTSQSDPATAANSGSTGSSAADLPPCPPPKVVVRNGGTAEGTVQLTGGTAAKNPPQRVNTERLLASTEDELKTTAGRQLDSAQQETVKQIHQYQAQSKTALQAGDLELAHNLAVKAHLLADQLVKPQP
jgi:hypothetical protein